MTNQSFENLDFSFLIETDTKTAYLQEWEDGAWGEPEIHSLPVSIDTLPKRSKLARAVKSFRDTPELRELLESGLIREEAPRLSLKSRILQWGAGLSLPIFRTDP